MSLTPTHSPVSRKRAYEPPVESEGVDNSNESPNKRVSSAATRGFQTPLSSPTRRQFSVVPPSVGRPAPQHLFEGLIETTVGTALPNFQVPSSLRHLARTTRTYTDDQGTLRNVMKQHSTKDCGATALTMLLTDLVRKNRNLQVTNAYWEWYANCDLVTAQAIADNAKHAGVVLETHRVPHENPLQFLQNLIRTSGHSVISAIDHPTIGGHWIVVDRITRTHTFMRDPNTGKAYRIPNEVMQTYFQGDDDSETGPEVNQSALSISSLTF